MPARAVPVRRDPPDGRDYLDVAAQLLEEFPPGRPGVLVLAAAAPEQAVTSVVAGLAAALASRVTGEVLAVDGNLRDPRLAEGLVLADKAAAGNRPGLIDVLTGRAAWEEAVCGTGVRRLDVLPGRIATTDRQWPGGLPDWSVLLGGLRRAYQFVLVDAPPLDSPETCRIARHADGACLVIRLGQTGRRAARRAVRTFQQCGGRVLGCLLATAPAAPWDW